jgi:CarD family transcriptional regulator
MHGAGIIEAIEEKKFLKQKQSYYIMKMPIGDMKVMIPIKKSEEIGIRYIIDKATGCEILAKFKTLKANKNDNWNKRYRENMIKIRSGNIMDILDVVKSLMLREKEKGLSTSERKMLSNAKQILISELVLAKVAMQDEIERELQQVIDDECSACD